MGSFFNFLGHAFETFFKIMPTIGGAVNIILISIGVVGGIFWIYYMMKDPQGKDNFLSEEKKAK